MKKVLRNLFDIFTGEDFKYPEKKNVTYGIVALFFILFIVTAMWIHRDDGHYDRWDPANVEARIQERESSSFKW